LPGYISQWTGEDTGSLSSTKDKIRRLLTYLEITYITFTVTLTLSFEIYLETIVPKFMQFWLELAALEKLC